MSYEFSLDTDTKKNTSGVRSKTSVTVELDRDKIIKTAVAAAAIVAPAAAPVIAKTGAAVAGNAAFTSISRRFIEQFAY